MGLDVGIMLVVGVPLLDTGEIVTNEEVFEETNTFGKPTGRKVTVRTAFFIARNDQRFEIGSNERNLNFSGSIEYDLSSFPEGLVHLSDWNRVDPIQVILGVKVSSSMGVIPLEDRFEQYRKYTLEDITAAQDKAQEEIYQLTGFYGCPEIFVIATYSY